MKNKKCAHSILTKKPTTMDIIISSNRKIKGKKLLKAAREKTAKIEQKYKCKVISHQ